MKKLLALFAVLGLLGGTLAFANDEAAKEEGTTETTATDHEKAEKTEKGHAKHGHADHHAKKAKKKGH